MNAAAIELRNLRFRYGALDVLKDVSFAVLPQERFVIMGQSGAGKTTILRLILGFIAPVSGSVFLAGRDLTSFTTEELLRVHASIAMVFEE